MSTFCSQLILSYWDSVDWAPCNVINRCPSCIHQRGQCSHKHTHSHASRALLQDPQPEDARVVGIRVFFCETSGAHRLLLVLSCWTLQHFPLSTITMSSVIELQVELFCGVEVNCNLVSIPFWLLDTSICFSSGLPSWEVVVAISGSRERLEGGTMMLPLFIWRDWL